MGRLQQKLVFIENVISNLQDGRQIDKGGDYEISTMLGITSLEIFSANERHSGKYTCRASNKLGEDETTCKQVVERESISVNVRFSTHHGDDAHAMRAKRICHATLNHTCKQHLALCLISAHLSIDTIDARVCACVSACMTIEFEFLRMPLVAQ